MISKYIFMKNIMSHMTVGDEHCNWYFKATENQTKNTLRPST